MNGAPSRSPQLFCLLWVLTLLSSFAAEPTQAQGQGAGPLGKVAYVQGGDLWVKALPDGPPRRLTTDVDVSYPTWSASGRWLSFKSKDTLWAVSATKAEARPFKVGESWISAWFPAQDILAYSSGEDGLVRALNPENGHNWVILKQAVTVTGWSLSPDGRWITYVTRVLTPENAVTDTLWRVRIGGGRARQLARTEGMSFPVGWSRDGKHILFWQLEDSDYCPPCFTDGVPLEAVAADGGKARRLLPGVLPYDDFVASSPDGRYVAVVAGGGRETWDNKHLLVVPLGTEKVQALTDQGVVALSPRWSPDGQWVAYVAAPDPGALNYEEGVRSLRGRRVWVVRPDKSRTSQLTRDEDYRDESPLWSTDGRHILFLRLDKDERVSLWLMRSDGAEQHQVVDGLSLPASLLPPAEGYYGYVRWSEVFDWWREPKAGPRLPGQTKARR